MCPTCRVLGAYAGTEPKAFADPSLGEELASAQYANGADVIFHAAGKMGDGVFAAAKNHKARAIGVTSQSVAQSSRTILSGTTIGQYREGDKLVDIVLRQPQEERNAITDLGSANLPTASGRSVPLTQVAKVGFGFEPGVMWREGRKFAVTVQGDVVVTNPPPSTILPKGGELVAIGSLVRHGQLRQPAAGSARIEPVRPRQRGVHRRRLPEERTVRARRQGHDLLR